ncbi:hypothetical protein J2129_000030 [Methanofollis sp. W23]|nr:hypothetical protein [Methanofollis sp. W23]MBP2144576.1 hypothetical protein [Methanofollis sp. W23]
MRVAVFVCGVSASAIAHVGLSGEERRMKDRWTGADDPRDGRIII